MMPGCHQRRKYSSWCRLQVKLSPVHLGCRLGIFNKSLEGAVAVAELCNGACREQGLPHQLLAREEVHHIRVALVFCINKIKKNSMENFEKWLTGRWLCELRAQHDDGHLQVLHQDQRLQGHVGGRTALLGGQRTREAVAEHRGNVWPFFLIY